MSECVRVRVGLIENLESWRLVCVCVCVWVWVWVCMGVSVLMSVRECSCFFVENLVSWNIVCVCVSK